MKNVVIVGLVLVVVAAVLLIVFGLGNQEDSTVSMAPEIRGLDLDDQEMALSDFRGKVVMLDFWASWCGPCRRTFPHNIDLVNRMEGRPFVLLGVTADSSLAEVQKVVRDGKLNWRSWWDRPPEQKIVDTYKVQNLPTIFLIDHKGQIRKKWIGAPEDRVLDQAVEKLVIEAERDRK